MGIGRLEADAITDLQGRDDVDQELTTLVCHHDTKLATAIVGMVARDVVASHTAAVHATGKPAAVDLGQRLEIGGRWRCALAIGEAVEERAIAVRHRGHVLRPLLSALDLQAGDAGLRDVGKMIGRREILRGDEVAAIELGARGDVIEYVVLATGLRARAAIGTSLRDHARHEALAAVRDAEGAVNERLEAQLRHGGLDGTDVRERVLAREDDALDPELAHDARATYVVDGHLRGAVNLEAGIDDLDQADEADILHDGGVDAAVDRFTKEDERLGELTRFQQDVQREVDAAAALVREPAGFGDLIQRELRAFVAGIEAIRAQIDGIGTVGEGGAHGVKRSSRGEQLGNDANHHASQSIAGRHRMQCATLALTLSVVPGRPTFSA